MTAMTLAASLILVAVVATFFGWALRWLLIDARERRIDKEAADRFVASYRAHVNNNRYLRDESGRPD